MPYIKDTIRREIQLPDNIGDLTSPGELNYVITEIVSDYILHNGLSYGTLNAVIGVLECAKQELYRRVCSKYEDLKMIEHGDVYPKELL